MKKAGKTISNAMLELWRPPKHSGDPIGCIATTYTFSPVLFDEQCLARFLGIESEPDRESLAFLLERETRLGCVYAGILADYTQAGVEHSLRWDVLPVRVQRAKQHAKLSLLAWSHSIRIIISSANLTEPGYRVNHEVTGSIEITPDDARPEILQDAIRFLDDLLLLVPGRAYDPPEVKNAGKFLRQVESLTRDWKKMKNQENFRQQLIFTFPSIDNRPKRSSLDECIQACKKRGGSPQRARIASPFFDIDENKSAVTSALCKMLARSSERKLCFCVPSEKDPKENGTPRLQAPRSILQTPKSYDTDVTIEILPDKDPDKNPRPWHAKMLALSGEGYCGLMIGSSNFTGAGMGIYSSCNVEANLLTIADKKEYRRESGRLEAVWHGTTPVPDPENAEWLGGHGEDLETDTALNLKLPEGFLSATYQAGDRRHILFRFEPSKLPQTWTLMAAGSKPALILSSQEWQEKGSKAVIQKIWEPAEPPERLVVKWEDGQVFMPINVEDSHLLPAPSEFKDISAEDLICILAASDPGAAFRAWARRRHDPDLFDSDLDSATPIDLDPLKRYNLNDTFLHRIRHRARLFAMVRANMERPVWSPQALEWRLKGLIGIEALADKLLFKFDHEEQNTDENLLTLADFLIVLREVHYQPDEKGPLSESEFKKQYKPFLIQLSRRMSETVKNKEKLLSRELVQFWNRVVKECQK